MIIFFGGYVCRAQEVSFRMDFLLQKDYQQEKERNQLILDNMMPAYVVKLLQKERQATIVQPGSVALRRPSQDSMIVSSCLIVFCRVVFLRSNAKLCTCRNWLAWLRLVRWWLTTKARCPSYSAMWSDSLSSCHTESLPSSSPFSTRTFLSFRFFSFP